MDQSTTEAKEVETSHDTLPVLAKKDKASLEKWIEDLKAHRIEKKTRGSVSLIAQDLSGEDLAKMMPHPDGDYDRIVTFLKKGAEDPTGLALTFKGDEFLIAGYYKGGVLGRAPKSVFPSGPNPTEQQQIELLTNHVRELADYIRGI